MRGWEGVGDGASRFLGYARNDMGVWWGEWQRGNHKGCPYILGISPSRRIRLPSTTGVAPTYWGFRRGRGVGDSGWGWGRRVPGLSAPHHVIPSVAEESRRLERSQGRASRFLGYARNDMGGRWGKERGAASLRGRPRLLGVDCRDAPAGGYWLADSTSATEPSIGLSPPKAAPMVPFSNLAKARS